MTIDHPSHVWLDRAQPFGQEEADLSAGEASVATRSSSSRSGPVARNGLDRSCPRSESPRSMRGDASGSLPPLTRLRVQAAIAALLQDGAVARAVAGGIGSAGATQPQQQKARWSRPWPVASNGGWPDRFPQD